MLSFSRYVEALARIGVTVVITAMVLFSVDGVGVPGTALTPAFELTGAGTARGAAPRAATTSGPTCVAPSDGHHIHTIYAHAVDVHDRAAELVAQVQEQVRNMDADLDSEAMTEGHHAHYRFDCDIYGRTIVDDVTLQTGVARTTFATIVSDLTSLGYARDGLKYLVWFDGTRNGLGGQATLCYDDTPGPDNCSNTKAGYAVNFGQVGSQGAMIDMHELARAMGAVQLSAPHSTGEGHVTQGEDVMCASLGCRATMCAGRMRLDCMRDDYWSFNPRPGSYLADHFDLARDSVFITR